MDEVSITFNNLLKIRYDFVIPKKKKFINRCFTYPKGFNKKDLKIPPLGLHKRGIFIWVKYLII